MASNLYTFNPFNGVTAGIQLVANGVSPTGRQLPLHLMVGQGGFIQINKSWLHPPLARGNILHEASVVQIEPLKGKPFEVFAPRNPNSTKLYVSVDATIPKGVILHADPDQVNAWYQLVVTNGVRSVLANCFAMAYFLEFSGDGDEADIWYPNGYIARLQRTGDDIVSVQLTGRDIAKLRIEQLQEQLDRLNLQTEADMRRAHGILAGVNRLLAVIKNRQVQDVYVDFLTGQVPNLTDKLRAEIRQTLLYVEHPFAGNFLPGWTPNVVSFQSNDPNAARRRADALRKKRERADEERARREGLKGSSDGGSQQKRGK